jgi:hypothetical protein
LLEFGIASSNRLAGNAAEEKVEGEAIRGSFCGCGSTRGCGSISTRGCGSLSCTPEVVT